MKKIAKYAIASAVAGAFAFSFVALSCRKVEVRGTADTAFAETPRSAAVAIPRDALNVVEALQSSFRAISSGVLPSVVEIDFTEKTTVSSSSPFDDLPFFFFGLPNQGERGGQARERVQQGLGSGVIVRRTGDTVYVLTNNHVAGKADEIKVKLNDGREFSAKLIGADERQDIALVSFEAKAGDDGIVVAKLGDSDAVQTGDICLAMGAPLGYSQSVTQGIVSATGRSGAGIGNLNDFIQTDAAINQGNSGGPLVNIYGEVIGINTWIASSSGGSVGLGFAIPINAIKKAIDDFISKGKITYGWLGVSLVDINENYKEALGVKGKSGAFASQPPLKSHGFYAFPPPPTSTPSAVGVWN